MRRVFFLLMIVAAFLAGGYVFAIRGTNNTIDTTTTSTTSATVPITSTSSTTSTTGVVAQVCDSNLLNVALTPTGGGLGTATFQLVFQNTGGSPCTLKGTPALQLRDSAGALLPTTVVSSSSGFADAGANHAAALVTLSVGGRAFSDAVYPTVPAGSERSCAIASSIVVTAPQTNPVTVATSISPCAHGLLRVSPIFG